MLSDALGHTGHIWNHAMAWARGSEDGAHVIRRAPEMAARYADWMARDALTRLPEPPVDLLD